MLCSAWVWISLEGPPKPLTFSVQAVNFLVLFCEHHDVGVWFSSLRTFATSSTIKLFFFYMTINELFTRNSPGHRAECGLSSKWQPQGVNIARHPITASVRPPTLLAAVRVPRYGVRNGLVRPTGHSDVIMRLDFLCRLPMLFFRGQHFKVDNKSRIQL